MSSLNERKERFMRDPLPLRLGNLASSLNRIALIPTPAGRSEIIAECWHYIEWTAADAEPEVAQDLVEIQRQLTFVKDGLKQPGELELLKTSAREWSARVMQYSGLLEEK